MNNIKAIWLPSAVTLLGVLLSLNFSLLFLVLVFFGVCDVRQRWMDYAEIQKLLIFGGSSNIHYRFRKSRCRRNACQAAFDEVSPEYAKEVRQSFYEMGYRWYHLFPDDTFTKDSPFLTLKFYKGLIFRKK